VAAPPGPTTTCTRQTNSSEAPGTARHENEDRRLRRRRSSQRDIDENDVVLDDRHEKRSIALNRVEQLMPSISGQ